MVLFLPAFWLLVPGAAGLIGVTAIVGTNSRLGPGDFTATMVTVLAIALGPDTSGNYAASATPEAFR